MRRAAAMLSLLVLVASGCVQDGFGVFLPVKTDRYTRPGNHVPAELVEERWVVSGDGTRLAAVLARQPASAAAPTALYLHGQAADLDDAWDDIQLLWDAGYNVFAVDYRGYGRSEGEPSEAGLYLDAHAAFEAAASDARLDPARIVIWGFSLGTGVASELALSAPAALLVLQAPFTSLVAMIEDASPYAIPAEWFTSARFDTLGRIDQITMPLVVVHGTDDRRIPPWMGDDVFAGAHDPKRLVSVPGAGHDDVLTKGLGSVVAAIAGLAPSAAPEPAGVAPP